MVDARQQRPEAARAAWRLLEVSDSEPDAAAVERPEERDDAEPLRVWYLASLTAASTASVPGVAEERLARRPSIGTMRPIVLGQLHLRLVVEVRARHVQEACCA